MKFGTIDIPQALLLAPMEDVTDIAFRLICKRLGADLMYTEFVNSEGLARQSEKTKRKMTFLPEERPFGIQIYGGEAGSMVTAATMAEELGPDLIDINCGCWVRNVVGQGAGAGLLRDLPRFEKVVSSVVRSVSLPVTVKTRLGWDAESIRIVEVARIVEGAGAQALTIHCRTRAQGHRGEPDFSLIPAVKQAVRIPIIVNGGIDTAPMAERIFRETGCDGIMIARGAIQNPWMFREIKEFRATGAFPAPPSLEARIAMLLEHLNLSIRYKGERYGVIEFRKHYSGYLREYPGIARLRSELIQELEPGRIIEKLQRFVRNEFHPEEVIQDEERDR